jgi:hypothetical protein
MKGITVSKIKREGKSNLPFGGLGTKVNFDYNVRMKMVKTLVPPNTWAAFRAIRWHL